MKQVRQKTRAAKEVAHTRTPVGAPSVPPTMEPLKRKPGRPRKIDVFTSDVPVSFYAAKKLKPDVDSKALVVFRRAIADAEKAGMTPEDFDGGGTGEQAFSVTKESLQRRVTRRLNVIDRFLTDDKLIELLAFSSLKEVGIYEGIMLDKSLVLQGQPNVIISNGDRDAMATVLPRLMEELKRRKLIASVPKHVESIQVN